MWDDISPIGVVRNDGFLTEGFDGDPGKLIEVEHLIGCNMSFRKDVLHKIGYIDEIYGQGGRWEVDLTLRAIMAGYKVLYNPKAVVDHLGSPRQEIKRFSLVYNFRMTRNHCYLLVKNFGLFNKRTIIYILKQITQVIFKAIGRALKGILSIVYTVVAVLIGSLRGLLKK
jgi:GT2 family glycosyltransferase